MFLAFEKWQGCLNDFAVIWLADSDGDVVLGTLKRQAERLCHRHGGIGADGLLVLHCKNARDLEPYALTIINSDGSLAQNCGNGVRCALQSVRRRHLEAGKLDELPELLTLTVGEAELTARFLPAPGGALPLVEVQMGIPHLNADVPWYQDAKTAATAVLKAAGAAAESLGVCTLGNPHLVITSTAASRDLLLRIGPALQDKPLTGGINVHLVAEEALTAKDQARAGQEIGQRLAERYRVFVWERGAGETMACGSGACAVGALALATGLLARRDWVAVDMPGGRLYVKQDAEQGQVQLAGPAVFVYSGRCEV